MFYPFITDAPETAILRNFGRFSPLLITGRRLGDIDFQSVCVQRPIEHLGSGLSGECRLDVRASAFFAVKRYAAAAAGTADLGGDGSVFLGFVDERVHLRRRDIG
jgi:hypothetical protein